MKLTDLLDNPTVRLMLFLLDKKEARYSEMLRQLRSRGTLTLALKELELDGLVSRRVVSDVRPAQAYYSLTEKGSTVIRLLANARDLLKG